MVYSCQILLYTIIESLVYLIITRPDIVYVVHIVSQFVIFSTFVHWGVVLYIFQYLWGIVFQSLLILSTSFLELYAYFDVNYDSDPTYHKSVTSFCIFLGNFLISWKSKK